MDDDTVTRPTQITVTWQPVEGEMLSVTIEAPTAFPDVIAELAMHARQLMRDVHADILAQPDTEGAASPRLYDLDDVVAEFGIDEADD